MALWPTKRAIADLLQALRSAKTIAETPTSWASTGQAAPVPMRHRPKQRGAIVATKATATKQAAKTPAAATSGKAIERKALNADSKSEGMRMLFDAGYSVVQVKAVFDAPYGFVYGVALRHGVADTAAARRVSKTPTPKKAGRRQATPPARVTKVASGKTVAKKATASRPSTASATSRVAAKIAAKAAPVAKAKGRPTAARRAANRKGATQVSA